MLIFDLREIGNKLLTVRKQAGLTQAQAAEISGIADRTYADIERGSVNMRIETMLRICEALQITPNDILTNEPHELNQYQQDLYERLNNRSYKERQTALDLLAVYLRSLE